MHCGVISDRGERRNPEILSFIFCTARPSLRSNLPLTPSSGEAAYRGARSSSNPSIRPCGPTQDEGAGVSMRLPGGGDCREEVRTMNKKEIACRRDRSRPVPTILEQMLLWRAHPDGSRVTLTRCRMGAGRRRENA